MKFTKMLVVVTIIVTTVLSIDKKVFSWSLFNLFSDNKYSKNNLEKIDRFNPDKDILYLPKLKNKDIFTSIDDLSICRKKEVRKFIYIYLTRGRNFVINGIQNSHIYYNIIKKIFNENKDMPEDLLLLPLLESGFNPNAVSKSRAMGLWQFLKNTARTLGLKNNRWIDERRDIEKSTRAAIRHMKNLYRLFNSWELTLAAYNGGGGYIKRLMKKTGKTNFWDLMSTGKLKKETSEYVPRFIALAIIYKNQELFGIKDEIEQPQVELTEEIGLEYPVFIKDITSLTGISLNTIKKYNPELKSGFTPPNYKKYKFRIPLSAKKNLLKNINKLYKYKFTGIKRHRVKIGENLSKIARRYKKKTAYLSGLIT